MGSGDMTIAEIVRKKKRKLDTLKAKARPDALDNLESVQRIDITYTSNALEGNTLTAGETALVIEKGITVSGKPLKDHLEAVDHVRALDWVIEIGSQKGGAIRETDIRTLHQLVVAQSKPDIAGRYADTARFVNTGSGPHQFPSPAEVPVMMRDFVHWLEQAGDEPETAFEAHRRLVAIHPFNDGNGRTARLLMNLILIRGGYPPIAIRPEDRPAYIAALEEGQAGQGYEAFDRLMFSRLDQTLDLYLSAVTESFSSENSQRQPN
ncbi:Fic family protein [Brucella sp. IR073]|jgi:Fic family protein|uniref:Fic family protein n=1 Tax=unclassified Brucella TaxID=2632610 RepID=UPI003B985832